MVNEYKLKYYGHREQEDGNLVSFRLPDRDGRWRVLMPSNYASKCVLDWIKNEGIEDFLTEKYYKDIQYDKDNNIIRRQSIGLHSFTFFFNSFDGDIEIYYVKFGYQYSCGLIKDIENLFDFYNEKTINQIKDKIEEVYPSIKVKSIKLVKEDLSGEDKNFGDLTEWIRNDRNDKLNEILDKI
jgi:hypothetical protein